MRDFLVAMLLSAGIGAMGAMSIMPAKSIISDRPAAIERQMAAYGQ